VRMTNEKLKAGSNQKVREATAAAVHDFEKAMDDDLNTAQALAAVFDWVRELNTSISETRLGEEDRQPSLQAIDQFNAVLELWRPAVDSCDGAGSVKLTGTASIEFSSEVDEKIRRLIEQRTQARLARNFALADQIRDQIHEMGYVIEDTKEGIRWKKR